VQLNSYLVPKDLEPLSKRVYTIATYFSLSVAFIAALLSATFPSPPLSTAGPQFGILPSISEAARTVASGRGALAGYIFSAAFSAFFLTGVFASVLMIYGAWTRFRRGGWPSEQELTRGGPVLLSIVSLVVFWACIDFALSPHSLVSFHRMMVSGFLGTISYYILSAYVLALAVPIFVYHLVVRYLFHKRYW
jgi:hypothetical protein